MKKLGTLLILFVTVNNFIFAYNAKCNYFNYSLPDSVIEFTSNNEFTDGSMGVQVINSLDSVYFDLAAVVVNGSVVEFPVYMQSDDSINSLDFAFGYDHAKLDFDTIINMNSFVDALSYYNTVDSTVRLTSYSFMQTYPNDSILFIVRFNIISGQLCSSDLTGVDALLNGDACSHGVIECLSSGVAESIDELTVNYYPNPASDVVKVEYAAMTSIEIVSMTGQVVLKDLAEKESDNRILDVSNLKSGVYLIRVFNGEKFATGKLLVN
jgi:hypothetical protein